MRHTSRLKSFAWYSTAIMLVLLAVFVTVARWVIGSASDYRIRAEELAGQYLGQPVSIKSLDARLIGIKPTLLFQDVSLREESSNEQLAHFNQIGIALNPLSSLRHLQPIIDLTIDGANLVVIQQEDGGFTLRGVTLSEKAKSGKGGGDLGTWFLSQSRLALENSRIIWRNSKTGQDIVFNGVSVELQNMTKRHRLNASVMLPSEFGRYLRLALDIRGNLLNQNDWVGELYFKAAQFKPSQFAEDFDYQGIRFDQGEINLEVWSAWRNGLLESVEGEFDLSDLQISRNRQHLPVTDFSGQWRYQTGDTGWQLLMQKAMIRNGDEPSTPFRLQIEELNGLTSVRAQDLYIDRLMNFSPYLPGLSKTQHRQMQQMMPGGWVDSLRVDIRNDELIGAVASVKDLHIVPWEKLPGVSGLSAQLNYDGSNGSVALLTSNLVLSMPELFDEPLPLQQTRGLIQVSKLGKGWRVVADDLTIDNSDLHMQLGMSLQLQPEQSPMLSLVGKFNDGRAPATQTYLPAKIMSEGSVNWLSHAFLGGLVTGGSVLVHGMLKHSLMEEKQGRFEVRFDANDVTLDYMEGWPKLSAVRGNALFTGRGMEVNVIEGRLYNSRIDNTKVTISDFGKPVLKVQGKVQSTANDTFHFLREAPFSRDLGLQGFTGNGYTPIRLGLTIPLSDEMAASSPLAVDGDVTLQGNHLHFAKGVELHKTKGTLHFTEDSFTADGITTNMYGFPAKVEVFSDGGQPGERKPTIVAVRGRAIASEVRKELELPLLEMAEGESDWQARMTLTPGKKGGVQLDIYSDLQGISLKLPEPMGKSTKGERRVAISLGLGGSRRGIHSLQYGGRLSAVWKLGVVDGRVQRIGVLLGSDEKAVLPKQDALNVAGKLDKLNWLEWRQVINHYFPQQPGDKPLPLEIHMQRLHLSKFEGEPEKNDMLTHMPPISLDIHDFAYDNLQFGGIAGQIEPGKTRVSFNNFIINARHFMLKGNGHWRPNGKTRLKVKLTSKDLGKMFKDLGFASVIKGGEAKSSGEVEWPGSPLEFSLKTMAAKGKVRVEDGVIKQIDPGAGKMLGLLSLEALPRRLFLDFSDMAEDGLEFNTIEGDIRIRNGDAHTDNLVVKSLPADILVTGRTGLVRRDFDQLVSVVPNVAGTVSVAGALAWGPEVAALLALFQGLFKSGIDEATMTRYEIHGTWEKPEIFRLEDEPAAAAETETETRIPGID